MPIQIAGKDIAKVYVGDKEVSSIFAGEKVVFSSSAGISYQSITATETVLTVPAVGTKVEYMMIGQGGEDGKLASPPYVDRFGGKGAPGKVHSGVFTVVANRVYKVKRTGYDTQLFYTENGVDTVIATAKRGAGGGGAGGVSGNSRFPASGGAGGDGYGKGGNGGQGGLGGQGDGGRAGLYDGIKGANGLSNVINSLARQQGEDATLQTNPPIWTDATYARTGLTFDDKTAGGGNSYSGAVWWREFTESVLYAIGRNSTTGVESIYLVNKNNPSQSEVVFTIASSAGSSWTGGFYISGTYYISAAGQNWIRPIDFNTETLGDSIGGLAARRSSVDGATQNGNDIYFIHALSNTQYTVRRIAFGGPYSFDASTQVANIGSSGTVTRSITIHDSKLYVSTNVSGGAMYRYNLDGTRITPNHSVLAFGGMASDGKNIWGITNAGEFYSYDPVAGSATKIGDMPTGSTWNTLFANNA